MNLIMFADATDIVVDTLKQSPVAVALLALVWMFLQALGKITNTFSETLKQERDERSRMAEVFAQSMKTERDERTRVSADFAEALKQERSERIEHRKVCEQNSMAVQTLSAAIGSLEKALSK